MTVKSPTHGIETWLLTCAIMVLIMAVIGAITRLEEAGLSITEWNVVSGALPPLDHAAWLAEFEKYKATPEYRAHHFWMSLEDFQYIFFWEWLHRLWGRLIGLVFAIPLLVFWLRRQIPQGFKLPLLGLLILGGAQGAMGWYMVKSGLVDRPDVSHYRLAAHLGLAFIIYAALLWTWQAVRQQSLPRLPKVQATFCLLRHGWTALALVAVTIVWGAFTAGLDAGKIYNTWPLMGGGPVPPELSGAGAAAYADTAAGVQFIHRWIALPTAVIVAWFAHRAKSPLVAGAVLLQVALGFATLLSVVMVPVAALHQVGAFGVVTALLLTLYPLQQAYRLRPPAGAASSQPSGPE